ncbi:MobB family relaxase [Seonamhaeicola sp.]|uniref:MobB family relaxase n=1 Tax=Seonamhaeicola sp. TaxID=1912245 RepID=UPI00262F4B07|nr:MobB family relaxase [Seonamhaeicola sp.]
MYVTISPQKLGNNYMQSVTDFVNYLNKENEGKELEDMEHFFNHYGDEIDSKEVIEHIDNNAAKLKKNEPRFYSITLNPSQQELKHLENNPEALKEYTNEVMKTYAKAFNREIDGRKVTVDDIMYYAKVEHTRTFKGTDKAIRENAPYYKKIVRLENKIQQIKSGNLIGNIQEKEQEVKQLIEEAPHKQNGKLVKQGMQKEGSQAHIHIIVSRKDRTNTYSLSPGSKYKASEVMMNGKLVKRGFDRDQFFSEAEKTFDKLFDYNRNYVETYNARKLFVKDTKGYYISILGLPNNERAMAFKLLGKTGINTSIMNIPTNKVQLALKVFRKLKRGTEKAIQSSSIGI